MSESTVTPRRDAPEADGPVHPRPPTPVEPPPGKRTSELAARLITASILVPFVVYVIVLGGLAYLGTVMALVLLAQREFYGLIQDKGAHPLVGFGLLAGGAVPVVAYLGSEYHVNLLMTATLLAVLFLQLGKAQITEALASISGTFFGVFYVAWLLSHAIPLRNFHDAVAKHYGPEVPFELGITPDSGIFFMLMALSAVALCDAGAYFGGRAYGRRKLAPKISPGKTVEGALCGVMVGTLGALVAKAIFDTVWPSLSQAVSFGAVLVLGFGVSLVAVLGDLVESLLKRDADAKDAGRLLPGMGGVLDRIDSPLLGIPFMYYMLLFYVFIERMAVP